MVLGSLPTGVIKGEALEGYLRGSIRLDDWQNLSGREILRQIRAGGGQISNQAFGNKRRQGLGIYKHEERIRSLNPQKPTPRQYVDTNHNLALSSNFQYRFEVTGVDPETGDRLDWNFSLSSNTFISPEAAAAKMADLLAGQEEFYRILADTITHVNTLALPEAFL